MNCGAKKRMVPVADTRVHIRRGRRKSERGGKNLVPSRDFCAAGQNFHIPRRDICPRYLTLSPHPHLSPHPAPPPRLCTTPHFLQGARVHPLRSRRRQSLFRRLATRAAPSLSPLPPLSRGPTLSLSPMLAPEPD